MENFLIVLLIILGVALIVTFWYFVAVEFRRIALMKGHDEARYFWWTFLVGPIGMMMVAALPKENVEIEQVINDELPDI